MEDNPSGGIKISQIENHNLYEEIIKDMLCCICLDVVCKPQECLICQTIICEDCLQILTIAGKSCMTPKCEGKLQKANKFVREILSNLRIKCTRCKKGGLSYPDYISHLDKCEIYQNGEKIKLLKIIKEKDDKCYELQKDIENLKKANELMTPVIKKDPYIHLSKEALRNTLISFNLAVPNKMELYNSCVEGRLDDFKNLILNKKYSILEEVSAHNYYWTPFHYSMHYGQWEIIKFCCEYLRNSSKFEAALRIESNDGRCPILCLLRSNSLNLEKKTDVFNKFLAMYPYVQLSNEVKKEIKARGLENIVKKYHKG